MWRRICERYEDELLQRVIPFWEKHAVDRECGGYFTCLDRDGSVYDTTKYMWMQWRIVYMFGEFYCSARYRQDRYLEIARQGFDFLYRNGRSPDGSYYFALNRAGAPVVAPYNVFSDCFAAMGAAEMFRATGEEQYRQAAREAMSSYLRRVASGNPAGRWNKSLPDRKRYRSLGHCMMTANLSLVMQEALGSDEYDQAGADAIDLVLNCFYNPEFGVMFENIEPDGKFDLSSCEGRMLNPGHVLEAMWFVLNYFRRHNRLDRIPEVVEIIRNTLNFGWDRQYGGIFYFMDVLGKPHLELQHDMKLWWVHNEATIATLYAFLMTRDDAFKDWFEKLDEWSFSHFPDHEYGEWYAYLNRRGEPTHRLKGGKWKTFFHLPRMLATSAELMRKIADGSEKKSTEIN